MSLLLFYIFILTTVVIQCLSVNMLGPADIIYTAFRHCETKVTEVDVWISQRKYNRTTNVLDIALTTPWTLDDDMTLELTAEIKKEGGYKPGHFHMKDTVCKVLSTMLGDVFTEFLKVVGTDDCPIPDGKYEIKDFYFDNEKMNTPLLYGEYRTHMQIFKDEELKGCYLGYFDIVPKEP